jgi:outer membrane biosynthesis protein TonB
MLRTEKAVQATDTEPTPTPPTPPTPAPAPAPEATPKPKKAKAAPPKRKAKPAPKKAKAKKVVAAKHRWAPTSDEAVFHVTLSKSDRKEGTVGLAHLKRLNGKTYGAVRAQDWFTVSRLKRDISCGALTIKEPRS